jgi:hypothetical protein
MILDLQRGRLIINRHSESVYLTLEAHGGALTLELTNAQAKEAGSDLFHCGRKNERKPSAVLPVGMSCSTPIERGR